MTSTPFVGFRGDGTNCADIDECAEGSSECVNSVCDNSEGSYICNCLEGERVDNGTLQ